MDKFFAMTAFVRVADERGFGAAGRKLGVSTSAVTKIIGRLEGELGARLFNRTTRRLALTEAGQEFYRHCAPILGQVDAAEASIRQANNTPRGTIRVVVPISFGRVTVIPALDDFLARYPEISVELSFSDEFMQPVDGGFDLVVHSHAPQMQSTNLIKRSIAMGNYVTVASPAYLKKHGTPRVPTDLLKHNCIRGKVGPKWSFTGKDGTSSVAVNGNLTVWSGDGLREAACSGIGIARASWWLFRKDLDAGNVVEVLKDQALPAPPMDVLYPANPYLASKVRAFIDFLAEIGKAEPAPRRKH
jgi:DNA-binding transcriptional LysR family regulator